MLLGTERKPCVPKVMVMLWGHESSQDELPSQPKNPAGKILKSHTEKTEPRHHAKGYIIRQQNNLQSNAQGHSGTRLPSQEELRK